MVVTAVAIGGRLALDSEVLATGEPGLTRSTDASPSPPEPMPSVIPATQLRVQDDREAGKARSIRIPESASGVFEVARGGAEIQSSPRDLTYTVEVEVGLAYQPEEVAEIVDRVLADPRGWRSLEPRPFVRVATDPTIHIRLASPGTADRLCAPLDTKGRLSCRNGDLVVLNAWRWSFGAASYAGDLAGYRRYMVNHEFGHALGNAHRFCPAVGEPAPVMVQQTKGLGGCQPNPWPVRK